MAVSGNNLQRGVEVPSLNREKSWHFVPSVKAGDKVTGGDIIGSVQETKIVSHKIMVPNGIIGTVKSIEAVSYTHLDVYKRQLICRGVTSGTGG